MEGERKELSLPVVDNTRPTSYWLPRSVFQQLLYSEVCVGSTSRRPALD